MKLLIIWKDIAKIPNAKVIICETYCKDQITCPVVSWSFSRFNIHPASLKIQCVPRKFLSKTQSQTPTQVKSKTDTTSKHKRKTTSSKPTKTKLLSIAPNKSPKSWIHEPQTSNFQRSDKNPADSWVTGNFECLKLEVCEFNGVHGFTRFFFRILRVKHSTFWTILQPF